jgi:hypothetical protein
MIDCRIMKLIGTNMNKSSETWQRISGGVFGTTQIPKHQ